MRRVAAARRVYRLAAGLTAAIALASVPARGALRVTEGERPRPLRVAVGHESVVASQGSYCVVSHRSGTCADYAYPLRVKHVLDVPLDATVLLKARDHRIGHLRVSLLHATRQDFRGLGWSREARRVPGHPTWRRFLMPIGFGNANRLDIHATYRHRGGDSDWWAGIKPPMP